jgi:hypothetical protein
MVVGLVLCLMAASGYAQQSGRLQLEILDKLSDKASHVTDVTLDGPMLEMAGRFMAFDEDPKDADLVSIVKSLKGIYIKSLEFDAANQYTQADVEAIRKQLEAPGWSRIVTDIDKHTGEKNEIYLLKNGNQVTGVTILVAEARELTVVNIVGPVPIDKIASLEGEFMHDGKHGHGNKKDSAKKSKDKEADDEKK